MKIISKPGRGSEGGFALTITIIFLAVSLLIFGSMMYWISSNARVTIRNNQYNMSSEAAEAAVETVLANMDRDFLYQSVNSASYYSTLNIPMTNWPVQYVFSDTNGNTGKISVWIGPPATNTVPLNSQFSGLYGLAQECLITAKATPTAQSGVTPISVPATVSERLQFASIPLFQFAIFYNINLEIAPGQTMPIYGPVFCNASIWSGTANVTYSSTVAAAGTNNTGTIDPFLTSYTQGGTPAANFTYPPTSQNNALVMPIGTNNDPSSVRAIVELPPTAYANGTAAAYTTNGLLYFCNGADLIISNSPTGTNTASPTGTNLFVFFQDASAAQHLTPLRPDFYKLKTGGSTNYVSTNLAAGYYSSSNVLYAGYTFLTNALFYDWREGLSSGKPKAVQAVQIDISQFNIWQTNTATNGGAFYNNKNKTDEGHDLDSMYVYNAVATNSSGTLPAVRVVNGAQLPNPYNDTYGFTVATPFPVYIKGDYNVQWDATHQSLGTNSTAYTRPAAFMADSITILSGGWSDATTNRNPNSATDTTVNAAMLEGIEPSDSSVNTTAVPSSGGGGTYTGYSGGVENFLRLLEDWGSQTLTYNGSICVMYPSVYATNHWNANYYGIPTRHWAFDTNFRQQSGLPPLTPQSKGIIRGQWMAQ
jgi:hypothetical protein